MENTTEKPMILQNSYMSEGVGWPLSLQVTFTPELLENIEKAQAILKGADFIEAVSIRDDGLLIAEDGAQAIDDACRLGYSGVKVYRSGWYFVIQSRYDSGLLAEYELEEVK